MFDRLEGYPLGRNKKESTQKFGINFQLGLTPQANKSDFFEF